MSTTRDSGNVTTSITRIAAAFVFTLLIAAGYMISPHVAGAVASPVAAEELDIQEPELLASDCAVDGLVFADCNFEF